MHGFQRLAYVSICMPAVLVIYRHRSPAFYLSKEVLNLTWAQKMGVQAHLRGTIGYC